MSLRGEPDTLTVARAGRLGAAVLEEHAERPAADGFEPVVTYREDDVAAVLLVRTRDPAYALLQVYERAEGRWHPDFHHGDEWSAEHPARLPGTAFAPGAILHQSTTGGRGLYALGGRAGADIVGLDVSSGDESFAPALDVASGAWAVAFPHSPRFDVWTLDRAGRRVLAFTYVQPQQR